jgi:hypothetical protein
MLNKPARHESGTLISSFPICRGRVAKVEMRLDVAVCVVGAHSNCRCGVFLAPVAMGDEIAFAASTGNRCGTEILIRKHAVFRP